MIHGASSHLPRQRNMVKWDPVAVLTINEIHQLGPPTGLVTANFRDIWMIDSFINWRNDWFRHRFLLRRWWRHYYGHCHFYETKPNRTKMKTKTPSGFQTEPYSIWNGVSICLFDPLLTFTLVFQQFFNSQTNGTNWFFNWLKRLITNSTAGRNRKWTYTLYKNL